MPDWWTYRLSDFLMFEPETYYRLFELHNRDLWPAPIAALLAGVILLALAWKAREQGEWPARTVTAALALGWLWVAWGFHWRRYAPINLAAGYFAAGFALQGVLLAAALRRPMPPRPAASLRPDLFGLAVATFGLLLQPVLGPLLGRSWAQLEVFGLAPDPTTTVTLGLVLAGPGSRMLLIVPLLWCLITGATLWAMAAPDAWVMPVLGLLVVWRMMWRKTAIGERVSQEVRSEK
jgi:hypothetical protein